MIFNENNSLYSVRCVSISDYTLPKGKSQVVMIESKHFFFYASSKRSTFVKKR